jgi:hypothetical protein
MSDIPAGWAELLAAPLGPETPIETPLAVLPSLLDHPDELGVAVPRPPSGTER